MLAGWVVLLRRCVGRGLVMGDGTGIEPSELIGLLCVGLIVPR